MKYSKVFFLVVFPVALLITGCGASNSGGSAPDINSQIQGVANDANISNGIVTLYQYDSGKKGAVLASVQTDFQGRFSVLLSGYFGPVLFEVTGGYYVDDATGITVHLSPDQYLSTVRNITPGENIGSLAITPMTTIAAALAVAKMNQGDSVNLAIYNANNIVSAFYGFDILHTVPVNLSSGQSSYSQGTLYGLLLAGISQMASEISGSNGLGAGSLTSIHLADMMAQDALDGVLDGKQSGNQIIFGSYLLDSYNYRTKLSQASALFLLNSRNQSGLTWSDVVNPLNSIANSLSFLFPQSDLPKPIDSSAPSISLSFNNLGGWKYLLAAQASDNFTGISSLTITSSSGLIPPVNGIPGENSSVSYIVDFSILPDGPYTFTATAKNGINVTNQINTSIYFNYYNYCLINNPCRIIG